MTEVLADAELLPVEHLASIAADVWQSFLEQELVQDFSPADRISGPTMTGCVQISGDWEGTVFLQLGLETARSAAETMFMADPGSLSDDEIGDGLGELTNMVGGNIKSLLPGQCALSLPSVAEGENCTVRVPGSVLVHRVPLVGEGGPVLVSVWRACS